MRGRGFTLIELLVGVGVFSLAATLSFGSYSVVNKHWRASSVKEQALSELRFALDVLTTELAFGSAFPPTCAGGCDSFLFATRARSDMPLKAVQYQLDSTGKRILRAEMKTSGLCGSRPFAGACFAPLTSARTEVENFRFFVENFDEDRHPLITVAVSGVLLPGTSLAEPFSVSTSATPRSGVVVGALPPSDIAAPVVEITDPLGDSISTAAETISLSGTAEDNVSVKSMEVVNERTGEQGTVTMQPFSGGPDVTWTTSDITILPGAGNTITVRARDGEDNVGDDSLVVHSTLQPPAPENLRAVFLCAGPTPFVETQWAAVAGATAYSLERCQGAGCTDFRVIERRVSTIYFDRVPAAGEFFQYRVQACSANCNTPSEYSNVVGVETRTDCEPLPPPPAPTPSVSPSASPSVSPAASLRPSPSTSPRASPSASPRGTPGLPPVDDTPPGPPPPEPKSFEITASPDIIEVHVNGSSRTTFQSTATDIAVVPQGGFNDPVSLSIESVTPSLPGFEALWRANDTIIDAGEFQRGAQFQAQVRGDTPLLENSTYQIVIAGSSGTFSDTVTVNLRVVRTGPGRFELTASPEVIDVLVNGSSRNSFQSSAADITVAPQGGFNGTVSLSVVSVTPSIPGFEALWRAGDAVLDESEFEHGAKFRAQVRGDTPPLENGTYQIIVAGASSVWSDTVTIYLRVRGTEGFEL